VPFPRIEGLLMQKNLSVLFPVGGSKICSLVPCTHSVTLPLTIYACVFGTVGFQILEYGQAMLVLPKCTAMPKNAKNACSNSKWQHTFSRVQCFTDRQGQLWYCTKIYRINRESIIVQISMRWGRKSTAVCHIHPVI